MNIISGIPTAKIQSQGTFIEGQKIILECVVTGNPIPTVVWRFGKYILSCFVLFDICGCNEIRNYFLLYFHNI